MRKNGDRPCISTRQAKCAEEENAELLAAITRLNHQLIHGVGLQEILAGAVTDLASITGSNYGLLGEVVYAPRGSCLGRSCFAVSRADQGDSHNFLKFFDQSREFKPSGLIGNLLNRQEVIVSNRGNNRSFVEFPRIDWKLHSFVGIPLVVSGRLTGFLIFIGRRKSYDLLQLDRLQPLLDQIAYLTKLVKEERRMNEDAEATHPTETDAALSAVMPDASRPAAHSGKGGALQKGRKAARNDTIRKSFLLREIHHQIKNNLQLISSLLRLQGRSSGDATVASALQDSRNRIDTIALLHEHLHKFANAFEIDFPIYVRRLLSHIISLSDAQKNPPDLKLDLAPLSLRSESTIYCGLILNELVTNCLRHAFPGNRRGTIYVRLRVVKNTVLLTVQDDGVGLPQDFDLRSISSLGTKLVQQLTKQLEGSVLFTAKNGTKVSLKFPLKAKK